MIKVRGYSKPDSLEAKGNHIADISTKNAALKGMTQAEKAAYLKDYIGFEDETEDERLKREENELLHEQTPQAAREIIRTLQRKIFYLYMFMAEQGFSSEVDEYLEEHMDTPAPFEEEW